MKLHTLELSVLCVCLLSFRAAATTYYVDINSANPVPPYTNWSTASVDIQSAVNETTNGDLVLVNRGDYQSGGYTAPDGSLTAVVVTNEVTLQSADGAGATSVNGGNAMRCVFLGNGAELIGFTIAGGTTTAQPMIDADNGGGIYCQSTNAVVLNCIIVSNFCRYAGAGIYSGTAIGCQIVNNTNQSTGSYGGGGGAAYSVLLNDTISGNSIGSDGPGGSGAFSCILSNCVVDGNIMGGVLNCTLNSCTVENNGDTQYAGGAVQSTLNNCLVCNNHGGSDGGGAYDCTLNYCVISNNISGSSGGGVYYDLNQTNAPGQQNIVVGNMATNASGVGGGVYLGINTTLNNWTFISNSAAGRGGGLYVASPVPILNCTFQGNSSGANGGGMCGLYPPYPYFTSASNCTFVANVAAGNGGGAYSAALTNCYVIGNKAANGGGNYGIANNCILNENSAMTNGGGIYIYSGPSYAQIMDCAFTNNLAMNGGGACADFLSPDFTNCIFWANRATNSGGGVYGPGTLSYCIVSDNSAEDGGGAYNVSIVNCLLNGNSAAYGGGAFFSSSTAWIAQDSTIAGNSATNAGGGLYWSVAPEGQMTNSIIYDNSAPSNVNYPQTNFYGAGYCCTTPLPSARAGQGNNNNITNDPSFMNAAGGDFHLSFNSPCINSGNNGAVAGPVDLDGNPRIVGGTVDIGAYEYQTPVSQIPYVWLEQYGLPIVAGIDNSNFDGTAFNVYQDWIAGLNPTNPASVLAMQTPVATNNASGIKVTWLSVSGISYFLQRSTNLASQPAFSTIQSNIIGQSNTTSYTDTSATTNFPYFYRVGVVAP